MKFNANTSALLPSAVLRYATWLGTFDDMGLPLAPENYQVTQLDNDRWSVTDLAGTQLYLGIGPVTLLEA